MQTKTITINDAPRMLRIGQYGQEKLAVDREAGVIRGYSVITRGEARGHRMWIDSEFLNAVANAGGAAGDRGVKTRFTHPGLSGDGMGKVLGRSMNFRRFGDRVLADLHFLESAANSPSGDLRGYVMGLAEEAPDLFGASIVFKADAVAMDQHRSDFTKNGKFTSPDPENKNGYDHARLAELAASDVVDTPAANPAGMFAEGGELAARAETLLEYALGLSDEEPNEFECGPHPERMRAFVDEFLKARGLCLMTAEALEAMREKARLEYTVAQKKAVFGL